MSGRAKTMLGGAALLALGALLLPAAPAGAASVIAINTFVDADPGAYSAKSQRCPRRFRHPISGGFSVKADETFQGMLERPTVSALRVLPDRRRWAMQLAAGSEDFGGTLYVLCSRRDPGIKVGAESVDLQPGATFTVRAACPPGTRPVSHGWRTIGTAGYDSGRILVTEIRRDRRRGWLASGYHVGTAPSGFRLFAYCSKRTPKLVRTSRPVPELLSKNRVRIRCARGLIAYSAGFVGAADAIADTAIYGGSLEPDLALAPNDFRISLLPYQRSEGSGAGHLYCGPPKIKRSRKGR